MKAERDRREVAIIEYDGKLFDYDNKARERMRIAKEDLENNGASSRPWTYADDSIALVSVADFEAINSLAATRSEELHFQYRKLKVKIKACTDITSVQAISFDTDCSDVVLQAVVE